MTHSENLQLADELLSFIFQTGTWEERLTTSAGIKDAVQALNTEVACLPARLRGAGRYEDDLRSAVWGLVNAHIQEAFLYGYQVAQALQDAARRPQDLTSYQRGGWYPVAEKERRRTLRNLCKLLEGMDAHKLRLVYLFALHLADRQPGGQERPQEDTGAARA